MLQVLFVSEHVDFLIGHSRIIPIIALFKVKWFEKKSVIALFIIVGVKKEVQPSFIFCTVPLEFLNLD